MSKGHEVNKGHEGAKGHAGAEKTKETAVPHDKKAEIKVEKKSNKEHAPMPDGCHSWGCKAKSKQFNFCAEHYDHFKFGLIKKTGEPVSDYEKKFGHYMAYLAKQKAAKVA
jgi:hypothetical protein